MSLARSQIQQAYVTFFNRPADVDGLNYWSTYSGSLVDLYRTFAQSTEYTALFAGRNNTQIVETIYANLFGRSPDVPGLNYWVLQLDTRALDIGSVANAITFGAQGSDATIVANKTSAASSFTEALNTPAKVSAYAGASASGLAAVKVWLSNVSSTTASLASATAAINPTITTVTDSQSVSAIEANGTLRVTGSVSSSLTVDLTLDALVLGSSRLTLASGSLSQVKDVDLSGLSLPVAATPAPAAAGAVAPAVAVSIKGDDQGNTFRLPNIATTVEPGGGADTIFLGSAVDRIVFAKLAIDNGIDTIHGFRIGAGGDVLNFAAFLNKTGTGSVATAVLASSTAAAAWANGDVIVVQGTGLNATGLAGLFGANKALAAPTESAKAVIVAADIIGDTTIWFLVNQNNPTEIAPTEIQQVGILKDINNLSLVGMVAGNFA